MAAERHFPAMGTDATVIVVATPPARAEALAERAAARIAQLEARWSRFIDRSEVSRINRSLGAPVEVSADTALLVRRIVDAWELTGGLVDCTRLGDVIAAGYDRSFDQLAPVATLAGPVVTAAPAARPARSAGTARSDGPARSAGTARSDGPAPAARARLTAGSGRRPLVALADPLDIVVDGSTVVVPVGLALDPGGIGKGLAADIVTAGLLAAGADGACVNLGGDLRVRGTAPVGTALASAAEGDPAGWTISVDHPHRVEPLVLLGLGDGAVASSTTLRRRWMHDGEVRHHLIDPRTGAPSASGVTFASAVAAEGWQAEALAKAVLLSGRRAPFAPLEGTGAEALAADADGRVAATPGLARFTSPQTAALPAAFPRSAPSPLEARS